MFCGAYWRAEGIFMHRRLTSGGAGYLQRASGAYRTIILCRLLPQNARGLIYSVAYGSTARAHMMPISKLDAPALPLAGASAPTRSDSLAAGLLLTLEIYVA